ncbi:PRC-barrel domain-containing protein [Nitratireductor thuwali]|uniref:PRC-barrel domain-containing protein n=1 Tax=Nitratireductor thuwali TaxID=2267699 RepID=A0ABY5MJ21_9HYPH|nr:hypothetical protein NTH_01666 [Nitratireductor thuwali]
MIRNLLATTAIATLVATGAVAQTTTPADPAATQQPTEMTIRAEGNLASNIIGKSVYNGTGDEAENIGEVNDLVLSKEGDVQAIVVGVGGFLGIGQKEVALEYDLVEWAERDGDRWLVVETTADALKAQPEFERSAYRPMPADADVAETRPATADDLASAPQPDAEGEADGEVAVVEQPADGAEDQTAAAPADDQTGTDAEVAATEQPADGAEDQTAAAPADDQTDAETEVVVTEQPADGTEDRPADQTAAAPAEDQEQAGDMAAAEDQQAAEADETQTAAVDRQGQQEASPDQLRADNLMGTAVYGANDEHVGEIGDVVLTPEGEVEAIIVDVGGFLGLGEKEVAISMEKLVFTTDEGGDLFLYTELTQEQLEAQPAYDEAAYAEQRDEMLLRVE